MAAGVAAAAGSAAVATMCDSDPQFKPTYFKNLKDPMTIYAQHAIKRETKLAEEQARAEELKHHDEQEKPKEKLDEEPRVVSEPVFPKPTLQATSQAIRRFSERPAPEVSETQTIATAQATSPSPSSLDTSLAPVQPPPMTAEEVRIEEKTRKAKQHSGGLKIFSGNGNMSLALEIAKNLGINLGKATVGRFADGEVNVVIHENVRGKDVYVIQPTCTPVNDNLMELLLMVSTLRRASARRITVVIPYYGYARQDRKMQVNSIGDICLYFFGEMVFAHFLLLNLLGSCPHLSR
jgi:hypothetical protein